MNSRISLIEIADRCKASILLPTNTHVSTSYTRDYMTKFGSTFPAIWICAQRLTPKDDGRGYSGTYRQNVKVEIVARIVVQRYVEGVSESEAALNTLHNVVADALKDWKPTGTNLPLVWMSSIDGPAHESVLTADLIFSTEVTYQRAP